MSPATAVTIEHEISRLARRVVSPADHHIGVDVVDIAAFTRQLALGGDKLARRWFTDAERMFAAGDQDRLAASLAGKEAVAKVLGTGIRGAVRWTSIEILRRADGAPYVRLHGGADQRADDLALDHVAITLCHEGPFALAVASGCFSETER